MQGYGWCVEMRRCECGKVLRTGGVAAFYGRCCMLCECAGVWVGFCMRRGGMRIATPACALVRNDKWGELYKAGRKGKILPSVIQSQFANWRGNPFS